MDAPASPNSQTPQDASSREIDTQVVPYIEGDVNVGGDFVNGDQIINNIIQQAQTDAARVAQLRARAGQ